MWPYLETESLRCRQVKMRLHWIQAGPKSFMTCVLVKKSSDTDTDTQKDYYVMAEADIVVMHFQAKKC